VLELKVCDFCDFDLARMYEILHECIFLLGSSLFSLHCSFAFICLHVFAFQTSLFASDQEASEISQALQEPW
jgi:hypothetical protein